MSADADAAGQLVAASPQWLRPQVGSSPPYALHWSCKLSSSAMASFQESYGVHPLDLVGADTFAEIMQAVRHAHSQREGLLELPSQPYEDTIAALHHLVRLLVPEAGRLTKDPDSDYVSGSDDDSADSYSVFDPGEPDGRALSMHTAVGARPALAGDAPAEGPGPVPAPRRKRPRGRRAGRKVQARRATAAKQQTTSQLVLGCVERLARGVVSDCVDRLLAWGTRPKPKPPAAAPASAAGPRPAPASPQRPAAAAAASQPAPANPLKRQASRPASEPEQPSQDVDMTQQAVSLLHSATA